MISSAEARRPVSESVEEQLWNSVSRLTRGWLRLAREEARSLGLSLPQLVLLGLLRESGTVPVSRWAEAIGSSPSAATGLLDRLESEGYVSRAHGGSDRRQVLVALTPNGRKLADRLTSEVRRRWRSYLARIPADQLRAAGPILERFAEDMDAVGGGSPGCGLGSGGERR